MADKKADTFETKMARLEAIVGELERGDPELSRVVDLFKEGKTLARECEAMLKVAQGDIDRAMEGAPARAGTADNDELPF
ncbi:MAG: exodeoxyribonuclease VII small subunit [Candidatus Eremiobacteraeota bacterium]|nr:exodeoxyribonuclease VII small subunit [Candidatus Eremiobacteraeota bacterium]